MVDNIEDSMLDFVPKSASDTNWHESYENDVSRNDDFGCELFIWRNEVMIRVRT